MATTFARLCQQVEQTEKELEAEIRQLTDKIDQLERVQSRSKTLRSVRLPVSLVAGWRVENRAGGYTVLGVLSFSACKQIHV